MFIIFNKDGSIFAKTQSDFVMQGSHRVNKVFIGFVDDNYIGWSCSAYFNLPNNTRVVIPATASIGGFEYLGTKYSGWVVELTSNITNYSGNVGMTLEIVSGDANVLFTYLTNITINSTGFPLEGNWENPISIAQFNDYMAQLAVKLQANTVSVIIQEKDLPFEGEKNVLYFILGDDSNTPYQVKMWNGSDYTLLGTINLSSFASKEEQKEFERQVNLKIANTLSYAPIPVEKVSDLPLEGANRAYLVAEDGFWYWWNGTKWVKGFKYQAANGYTTLPISPLNKSLVNNIIDNHGSLCFVELEGFGYDVVNNTKHLTFVGEGYAWYDLENSRVLFWLSNGLVRVDVDPDGTGNYYINNLIGADNVPFDNSKITEVPYFTYLDYKYQYYNRDDEGIPLYDDYSAFVSRFDDGSTRDVIYLPLNKEKIDEIIENYYSIYKDGYSYNGVIYDSSLSVITGTNLKIYINRWGNTVQTIIEQLAEEHVAFDDIYRKIREGAKVLKKENSYEIVSADKNTHSFIIDCDSGYGFSLMGLAHVTKKASTTRFKSYLVIDFVGVKVHEGQKSPLYNISLVGQELYETTDLIPAATIINEIVANMTDENIVGGGAGDIEEAKAYTDEKVNEIKSALYGSILATEKQDYENVGMVMVNRANNYPVVNNQYASVEKVKGKTIVVDGKLISSQPTMIKTVGFNAFDGELEEGQYDTTTGSKKPLKAAFRSKNYFNVIGGQSYTVSYLNNQINQTFYIVKYDKNFNYLGYSTAWISDVKTRVITLENNVSYIAFHAYAEGISVPTDAKICFHLTNNNYRAGEYEEHWSETKPLEIDELKSAGNAYDELTQNELIRRIGVVDLGTAKWYYEADKNRFYTYSIENIKSFANNSQSANLVCIKYPTSPLADLTIDSGKDKIIAQSNLGVYIKDTTYTDATEFKNSLSGVLLCYELATPTTTPNDTIKDLIIKVERSGTIETDSIVDLELEHVVYKPMED